MPLDKNKSTSNGIVKQAIATSVHPKNEQKIILIKDWRPKSLEVNANISSGVVVILGTSVTKRLASVLFETIPEIQVVQIIHDDNNIAKEISTKEIATNFYSISEAQYLYQQIEDKKGDKRLLGVIDITAFDKIYELSTEVELGKIELLQKLIEYDRNDGFKLLQVTYKLQPFQVKEITMQGARLAGLYRMLGAEYKQIQTMSMDSDYSIEDQAILTEQIQNEFISNSEDITECCYRDGGRYKPQLKLSQSSDDMQNNSNKLERYDDHEVVLIAGGTGGIGSVVAEHVVSQGIKNLVIIGRQHLPDPSAWKKILSSNERPEIRERLERMQSLVDKGVHLQYYNTSLKDQVGLGAIIDKIHSEYGPITGVFHCAGVTSNNPVFFKKPSSDIVTVCEPKMKGLVTLHKALEKEPLNFFILFSSVSSVIPTLSAGQSDYAMANAYMDYYALHQAGKGNYYFKAIQWPAWSETGMSAGGIRTPVYIKTGLLSLTTKVGLEFLDTIKKTLDIVSLPCIVNKDEFECDQLLKTEIISTGEHIEISQDKSKFDAKIYSEQKTQVDLRSYIIWWLKSILGSELKLAVDRLEEDELFDEYGIESVMLAQILQNMQTMIDMTLDLSLLLEYNTINALADYFMANHKDALQRNLKFEQGVAESYLYQEINVSMNNETLESKNAELSFSSKPISVSQPLVASEKVQQVDDIAVVGLSCRFPGSPTIEMYWDLLTKGMSAINPGQRWISKNNHVDYGGWIDDIDLFDPKFFRINENDARIMDPQARIILEESLKAIYDAGYESKQLSGKKVGVYIGGRSQPHENVDAVFKVPNPILGIGQNYMATNISRFFDFKGLSLVIDTACSSGITSMLFASDSLRAGRIDMALVGAVSILLNSFAHDLFAARGILNTKGELHIFDKRSSGEVLGEGAAVVMLKRLGDAIKDGNKIYGVIKAISINNDGRTLGPGSPNIDAQKQIMHDALTLGGKRPEDIGYIEVNGGGTPVVDSVEIKALSSVYMLQERVLAPCFMGSVKPNIGHLLLASGLAGFIRCVLSVYHKRIPPFLSALNPFEYYDFSASRIRFNRKTIDWQVDVGKKRIAAQNTFPDGGTNCHVLIEEYVPEENYQQRYFEITTPSMVKQRYPLHSLSSLDSSTPMQITDLPKRYIRTKLDNLKEVYRIS